ncbi:MAG TPA: autotransporter-associated beta strand repeat-containing protein [Opitutaceae bacterium]|nr:autotransporter-associated beta strand repeat-containing protein [Opitutaceae bacterium]HOR25954.1 autotransporter-associated beta strand repeat-containing protein [Opitutaceae bacterium]HPK50280.1 autotransporter-associated beta strand repeat-containing protein [Opitutaceae bacterium]
MHSTAHIRKRLRNASGAVAFALCALAAHAQTTVYWDTNDATSGAGTGSGSWTDTNWTTDSRGRTSTTSWTNFRNAVFSAGRRLSGNYTVSIDADVTTGNVTLQEGSPTFSVNSGVTLNLGETPDWEHDWSTVNLGGQTLTIAGEGTTYLTANLMGPGTLIKDGSGTLQIYGHNKSFTGDTRVNNGTVILDTLNNENGAILGNLYIGDGTGSANTAIVKNGPSPYANEMIRDSSAVTIRSDGLLNLNGQTETIGSLTFDDGGHASTGGTAGKLTVGSNGRGTITAAGTTTIDGGGQITAKIFDVTSGELTISANLVGDSLNPVKTGNGTLVLSGTNTYSNSIIAVNDGILVATNSASLGSTSNSIEIASGASLYLDGGFTLVRTGSGMTIAGAGTHGEGALYSRSGINTYQGDLSNTEAATIGVASGSTFNITPNNINPNAALTFSTEGTGKIDITSAGNFNSAVIKTGTGTLTLSGSSAMNLNGQLAIKEGLVLLNKTTTNGVAGSGAIVVGDGLGATGSAILRLNRDEQIEYNRDTITVNRDGVFDLNGHTENFNNNNNRNTLTLNGGELQLAGGQLDVDILKITADSVIDFGTPTGDANSTLWVKNLIIAAGVTVTVKNWNSVTDFFYADKINSTDGGSWLSTNPLNISPMNQIVFEGWDGSQTIWASNETNGYSGRTYNRIRPVPEPSTYGAILSLASIAALFWLRRGKA